jgi:ABC-type arginine/histidine transport system permease subunit
MEINFFNAANMALFWEYTRMLLKGASPGILLVFAVVAVGWLLNIIIQSFRNSAKDNDDDDIDIKHY